MNNDTDIEKRIEFVSWCIEQYSAWKNVSAVQVANDFSKYSVLDFLSKHYDVLHTQGKSYILDTIEDFIFSGVKK